MLIEALFTIIMGFLCSDTYGTPKSSYSDRTSICCYFTGVFGYHFFRIRVTKVCCKNIMLTVNFKKMQVVVEHA